ncbi:chemotaxis protein CheA [Thiomicrospira sp. WB1]|uniref:chemotaxis protein CheA n=1 Tax=Thiomicrospira sp. WB1 TaxID=1685380 RepID=UPI000748CC34|nr:chemotaxis protein CheA [Thiomicrospira sp. WB1]KUJ71533.1 chemotaxis protein CheA [Thiomicrospira sp. WB1]
MDEEILQDFLVEATELIEGLDEQLTELESSPTDSDLLNAVFRGFHTIKGGAGFLGITPLVELCHRAENVFDKIRNGDLEYDHHASDVIMRAFDEISDFIDQLNDGVREFDDESNKDLIDELDRLRSGGGDDDTAQAEAAKDEGGQASGSEASAPKLELPEGVDPEGEITDDEFEALLQQRDQLTQSEDGGSGAKKLELPEGVDPEGEITDDEFEALLAQRDQLEGQDSGVPVSDKISAYSAPKEAAQPDKAAKPEPKKPAKEAKKPEPKKADAGKDKAHKPAAESTVRVDTRRLDEIMNLVGELVLVRNRLLTLRGSDDDTAEELSSAVGNLDHVTTDLQASVMKTRMQPVKKVFGRFPRVVRDLSRKLGKEINLEMKGEDTDLDKNLVEALADPLVHLVRNSVDHGVEMPDEREAEGKPREGTVILAAEQEGDHILLSITDDGKGMDPDKLRAKAVEKGVMDEVSANQLDDKSAFELIMAAGFSTADQVSDISGRGVGMDVVKNMITKLNGSIDIHSAPGEGTRISIRVPLTLAILPTLMVAFEEDSYAIPLTSVQEIFDYDGDQINKIDGQMMVRLREKSVPLLFLKDWLNPSCSKDDFSGDKVVIVSIGNQYAGLVVDQVNGQEEVVIKPLGVMMKHLEGYAGATITGNGNIALILDLPGVLKRFQF